MALELTLIFNSIDRVTVTLTNRSPITIPFISPFTTTDWEKIQRYLEKYPVQYGTDIDDNWAAGMVTELKLKGKELFHAVFGGDAQRLFNAFQDAEGEERQLTIVASKPKIFRLPWELLCDPNGTYVIHEQPRIAIRRQLAGAGRGRKPIEVKPKLQLRLLMVVSRPIEEGISFIDPRAEAQAVLRAIDRTAPGRVVVEFLRPATLKDLRERLQDRSWPVDIVHFDGHGVFTTNGEVTAAKHDGLTKGSKSLDMGYLLFEDAEGGAERVSAEKLGDALNRQQVSLVVLSACQSATMGQGEDALGCVAAQLTNCGIPAVLAMTYSVLVTTTEQLFGKFYGELAAGKSLGIALANARQDLYFEQKRGLRWRGKEQIELELSDWFVPVWYQAGGDITLLKKAKTLPHAAPKHRLPELAEEGFFGRSWELWQIERGFVQGTRRMTIAGFGGQGKTYLAVEAGRWLSQTGMFDTVCFVDYAAFQGVDAVSAAVSEIGCVLEKTFIDAAAVTKALAERRTLIILDNLESLAAETLQELLKVAKEWSEVEPTRLLLARDGGLSHAHYPAANSRQHQLLLLSGLGNERQPEDALDYFQALMKLPPVPKWSLPKREALIELFKLVDFHPLSIKLVAYQCKERRVGDLAQSLELLLAAEPQDNKDRCLIASLNLSLQWLDADLLAVLPKLGVFQGGAFESDLLNILEFDPEQWQRLRSALEHTGLLHVEMLENIASPFLRFHPTLTPVLWRRLSLGEQRDLRLRHHFYYYFSVFYLYDLDDRDPAIARCAVRRDLPNLLWAVKGALNENTEYVASFVELLNRFLSIFGLKRDRMFLTEQLNQLVPVDSGQWYLITANQGKQLLQNGQYESAAEIFVEILQELDPQPSFDRVTTICNLATCLKSLGRLSEAAHNIETGLNLCEQLEQSAEIKLPRGFLQTELGDVLTDLGEFDQAKEAYSDAFATNQEIGNERQLVVIAGKLAELSLEEGDLTTALSQYKLILKYFQQLQEPDSEAMAWHQLGMVYEKGENWTAADAAYRESARISEQYENLTRAANTYGQLAVLYQKMNDLSGVEKWFLKTLELDEVIDDDTGSSKTLCNYAKFLLDNHPNRLSEACQLAMRALAIQKTLDPATGLLWSNYSLLDIIATAQGEMEQAREYRQLARAAKAAYAGTQYELEKHARFIGLVVAAVGDEAAREQLEPVLVEGVENGRGQLVAAIRQVLAGEREVEALWDDLNADDSMIIAAILRGV